jgi:arsenate reductase
VLVCQELDVVDAMQSELIQFFRGLESRLNINASRKPALDAIALYILEKQRSNESVSLNFICTHNARRSHFAQLLAAAAAQYADLENIDCYSGGVEVTRIHPHAVAALNALGFQLNGNGEGDNPVYLVDLGEANLIEVFSKQHDDEHNPQTDFAAITVCSDLEQNCPHIPGASRRFALPFEDPKSFDDGPNPLEGYTQRANEIAAEMLYVMTSVSAKL